MLDSDDNERRYKYSLLTELSQFGLAIFSVIFILLSLFSVFALIKGLAGSNIVTTSLLLGYITNFVGGIVLAVFNWSLVYSSPAVEVKEWGLRLKAFPLKTFEVKWDDISYVRKARWKPILHKKYSSIIVVKNGLTRLHRFSGVLYGGSIQPSFVISPNISDYDDLMKIISDGIKKSRRSTQQNRVEKLY